jgi:hypothetical protein
MITSLRCQRFQTGILLAVAAIFLTSSPLLAKSDLDPVVEDVLEMLEASVDEGVILQWLESTDRRPADIGGKGLIALSQAGASEELIDALLEGVEKERGQGTTSVSSASVSPPVEPVSEAEPTPAATLDPSTASVEALIQLRAKQIWVDEDEPDSPREPPWWIYLYLDGELVAWTRPTLQGTPVEARRVLKTGRREMRVILQRYEDLRGGWSYESLTVPTLVAFEPGTSDSVEIDVEMTRIWGLWRQRKDGGPLSYVIRQGDRILAEHGGTGGDPNRWSPVCEDVEANFPEATDVPKRFRNSMSRCIRWAELWEGPGANTDRADILERLAEYEFQPSVR